MLADWKSLYGMSKSERLDQIRQARALIDGQRSEGDVRNACKILSNFGNWIDQERAFLATEAMDLPKFIAMETPMERTMRRLGYLTAFLGGMLAYALIIGIIG